MSFRDRFASVSRLLAGEPADDEQRQDDDQDAGGEGSGDDQEQTDDQNDADGEGDDAGNDGEGGEGGGDGGDQGGAGANAGPARNAHNLSPAVMAAFEQDADRLVAAERDRCIGIFLSEPGRRNPDAAAEVMRNTSMDVTAATKFLNTFGGSSSRQSARQRLRESDETRVDTGASSTATDAKSAGRAAAKKVRDQRNAQAKARGGKQVNAPAGAQD